MDLIKTRGRKPIIHLNDIEALEKQKKRHEYYISFKSNHPDYYKKIKKVEKVELNKKNELLNKIDNIIQSLNAQLQDLKKLMNNLDINI